MAIGQPVAIVQFTLQSRWVCISASNSFINVQFVCRAAVMDILELIIFSSVVFLVLQFGLLPFVARKREGASPIAEIGRRAMEAGVSTAASIASLLSISGVVAFGLVHYLQNLDSSTIGKAENSLHTVRKINEFLSSTTDSFGLILLAFCAFATIIWSYRRTKISGQNELNSKVAEKMEELQALYLADGLEQLPSTEAMVEIEAQIAALAASVVALEESNDCPELIAQARNQLQQLAELRHTVDLLRRAEPEVAEHWQANDKEKGKSQWVTIFTSVGFFNTLGLGGKILAVAGVLSIVPASLVITGPIALSVSDETRFALQEDLRELTFVAGRGEVNQAYDLLVAESNESADVAEEDIQIADDLAQILESEFFEDDDFSGAGQAAYQVAGRSVARESVRQKILKGTVARSGSLSLSSARPASVAENLVETEKFFVESQKGKPLTPLGKQASQNYRELAQKKSEVMGKSEKQFQGLSSVVWA